MRTQSLLVALAILLAPAGATSQSTIVSPTVAATTEGTANNVYPFASPVVRRYQQIHGDIGGAPKIIQKLSFRMNASAVNYTGTRAIDLEMFIGLARPVHQTSFYFDQNYVGPRTPAIARKFVNMGPQGQAVSPGPNPFTSNMDLVLDTPFPYTGTTALVWEVVVYSNTVSGSFSAMDAESSSSTTGTAVAQGAGCVATGQTAAMTHTATYTDRAGNLLISFLLQRGPANAATLLAIGASNPNLAIPGLCSNLQTDLIVLLLMGVTDPSGGINRQMAAACSFVLPNTLGGAVIHSQAHALDPSRPDPIQICNSEGRQGTVPLPNLTRRMEVVRLWNDTGGTTALQAICAPASTIGYGLVTQFTY
jgi:hypothetical protein